MREFYGSQHMGQAKSEMYWNELKDFSPKQVLNVMTILIGECKMAPTLVEIRDRCAQLREKIRQFEREQERKDAADFWSGTYHPNDVKMIVATIKDRVFGNCDDKTWSEFMDFLKTHAQKRSPARCERCDDTFVFYDVNNGALGGLVTGQHPPDVPHAAGRTVAGAGQQRAGHRELREHVPEKAHGRDFITPRRRGGITVASSWPSPLPSSARCAANRSRSAAK